MRFPFVQRIDDQCKVAAAMMRMHRLVAIADQVKFLIVAQAEPSAREVKRGPIQHRQVHRVPIKHDAFLHIGDVDRNVIQLGGFHGEMIHVLVGWLNAALAPR